MITKEPTVKILPLQNQLVNEREDIPWLASNVTFSPSSFVLPYALLKHAS